MPSSPGSDYKTQASAKFLQPAICHGPFSAGTLLFAPDQQCTCRTPWHPSLYPDPHVVYSDPHSFFFFFSLIFPCDLSGINLMVRDAARGHEHACNRANTLPCAGDQARPLPVFREDARTVKKSRAGSVLRETLHNWFQSEEGQQWRTLRAELHASDDGIEAGSAMCVQKRRAHTALHSHSLLTAPTCCMPRSSCHAIHAIAFMGSLDLTRGDGLQLASPVWSATGAVWMLGRWCFAPSALVRKVDNIHI